MKCLILTVYSYFVLGIFGDFDSILKREERSISQGITSDNMSSTIRIGMLKPNGIMRQRCIWIYSSSLKRFVCRREQDSNSILKRQGRSTTSGKTSESENFSATVKMVRVKPNGIMRQRCHWIYSTKLNRFVCKKERDSDSILKRQGRSITSGKSESNNFSSAVRLTRVKHIGIVRPRCEWIHSKSLRRFVCKRLQKTEEIILKL